MYEKNNKITRKINVRLSGLFSKRAELRTCISKIILLVAFLTVAGGILGCCIVPYCKTRAKPGLRLEISTITKSIGDSGMIQPELLDPKEYISMLQKMNTSDVLLKTPRGWPINHAYSPKKSTGHFNYPEFSEIEVLLVPTRTDFNNASVYFNEYIGEIALSAVEHNRNLYELYFFRQNLIPGATPVPTRGSGVNADSTDPGIVNFDPTTDKTIGLGVLLQLYEISYSSRCGGSVRLDFQMVEDYYHEFFCPSLDPNDPNTPPYYYDLSELQMSLFVKPREASFRPADTDPNILPTPWQTFYVEFEPTVDYVYSGTNRLSGEELNDAIDHLHSQLLVYSNSMSESGGEWGGIKIFGPFVLGFLHNEHREQLKGDFVVDRISISDGEFSFYTHEAQYFLDIQYKILNVNISPEPHLAGKLRRLGGEVVIAMSGGHDLYGDFTNSPKKIVHGTRSNWYRIASIPIIEFYEVDANGDKAVVQDNDGNPLSHNNDAPCYELLTWIFNFYTRVLVWEEGPWGDQIFFDIEQYDAWRLFNPDVSPMNFKWITRRYPVDIRGEDQIRFGCGFEGEIEKLVHMGGGLWRNVEVTVPLGGPGEHACYGGSIKWQIRVNVYRR